MSGLRSTKNKSPIKAALKECRPLFWAAIAFSFFINILMLAVPLYSLQVLDRVLSSGSRDTLLMLTIIVTASLLFAHILTALRTFIFAHIGRWIEDKLSGVFARKTAKLAVYKPGIGSQPLRDLGTIKGFVTSQAMGSVFDAPWAIIFFVVIYMINITLGLVVTIGAFILLGFALWAEKGPAQKNAAATEKNIDALQSFDAILRNAEVVKAMGLLGKAHQKWEASHTESQMLAFSGSNTTTIISNITKSLRMALQILLTGLGAYFVLNREMSAGGIIAVSILSGKALAPFDAAITIWHSWVNVKKSHRRLMELDEAIPDEQRVTDLPEPSGQVQVDKVAWQEPRSKRLVLKGINITINSGESVGVIGPSGTGKTTLARILVNVLTPTNGAVRLDGADLAQWDAEKLGSRLGYLPQDVELFAGTIAHNIARLDDNVEDEKFIAAAQLANVHDFIVSLPQGYQTEIGVNGAGLSAGQRQRIALARAFFGKPKFVVLDEPNSNLDSEGENALSGCLVNARQEGITVIIIAHRPSVLHNVDNILVLHDGEAKLYGPAEEVMSKMAVGRENVTPLRKQTVE